MAYCAYYECPLGTLRISHEQGAITGVKLISRPGSDHCPSPLSDCAASQFRAYFEGQSTAFDFPIRTSGTPFQMAVWKALKEIPYGETRSYKDIAIAVGNPKAFRAVGMACNKNPVWIAVPCHRVIGSNRSLTGYEGGLEIKHALLKLEHANL